MEINPSFFFIFLFSLFFYFLFFYIQESTENVQAEGASANHGNAAMQSPHKGVRAKHSRARGCVHVLRICVCICVCIYIYIYIYIYYIGEPSTRACT